MPAWKKQQRPGLEGLESRSLLSGTTISGTVFQDSYQDGTFDQTGSAGADYALKGRTVFLDLNNDGKLDAGDPSAQTIFDGTYMLMTTATGTFNVRVVPLPGDVTTGPDGAGVPVVLALGQVSASADVPIFSGSSILPLSPSALPFGLANPSDESAQVGGLYRIILGRQGTTTEVNSWNSTWNHGAGISTIASSLLQSNEYETKVVTSYYANFLGRAGSQAEVAAWVSLMQLGKTEEQVVTSFLNSAEFSRLHTDNASFVQALYEDVLGREPVSAETAAWVSNINGGMARSQVIAGFLYSTEALDRAINGLYTSFLDREADSGGLSSAVKVLQAGEAQGGLAVSLASSAEYAADAHKTIRV
jgi:hypothetical protein